MKTIIKVTNLSKTFKTASSTKKALDNINLEIAQGECVVTGGENGSGKSVLMSIIAGLTDADNNNKPEVNGKVGFVFQEAETQILGETPEEDIAFGPANQGLNKEEIQKAVKMALDKTGLTDKKDFPARFLSGGEKRRLAIACMLSMNLPIIVLDEPYANLDYSGVKQVNKVIKELKKDGKTIIILTHELEKCLGLADRFIVLFRGKKVFDGSPQDGLKQDLESWNIRNPFTAYKKITDLIWE